jgi:glycyl-tRNA synthetase
MEGRLDEMTAILKETKAKCPNCGASEWTDARNFNMMFKTEMNGIVNESGSYLPVYLRPETAGAIFVEFKNVIDSTRMKIPFGIGQIGKVFRNEIVAGNFIFRLKEFEQMEIEYFVSPRMEWEPIFENWLNLQEEFIIDLGAKKEDLRRYEHPKEKLSHYSRKTIDIQYKFPFSWQELFGLAHRGDFDLTKHSEASGVKLDYLDTETNQRYIPHILEPTFGLDRSILVALLAAYEEESVNGDIRVVMKFPRKIAPVKVAVFPLLKNKPELVSKAREVYDTLKLEFNTEFDDNGNVGKRYRRQDEIGTPFCMTIDFDTLADNTITVRDRDTMKQERIKIESVVEYIKNGLNN